MQTILVVGATGNTGRAVMQTLPSLIMHQSYRILGLTRKLESQDRGEANKPTNVDWMEKDWTTIDAAWLSAQHVTKAYIACHNLPRQFHDESALNFALLSAGVKYVVRVSTAPAFMGPASPVYYGRAHWAIESQLSHPDFASLQWTSIQPNLFISSVADPAAKWITEFRKSGQQTPLRLSISSDTPVGLVAPEDVGVVGAHLLALKDHSSHSGQTYFLSGPEEVTGRQILDLVEEYSGSQVSEPSFVDMTLIDDLTKFGYPQDTIASIRTAMGIVNSGLSSLAKCPTNPNIGEFAPKGTLRSFIESQMKV